jgi:hypothetical protein
VESINLNSERNKYALLWHKKKYCELNPFCKELINKYLGMCKNE